MVRPGKKGKKIFPEADRKGAEKIADDWDRSCWMIAARGRGVSGAGYGLLFTDESLADLNGAFLVYIG